MNPRLYEWDDELARLEGVADLLVHVRRINAVVGDEDDNSLALINRARDLRGQVDPGAHVVLGQVRVHTDLLGARLQPLAPFPIARVVAEEDSDHGPVGS